MKRFLISNPLFTGQAEVVFNDLGILCLLDVSNTNMTEKQVGYFKRQLPVKVDELQYAFNSQTAIVEGSFEVNFDQFWKKYNKKINRSRCLLIWDKMDTSMQVKAYFGVEPYLRYLKKTEWRAQADPEKYLRNKFWENEY